MEKIKPTKKETVNVLVTLPKELNDKLVQEGEAQQRKRHAQIIFALEDFFKNKGVSNARKN